jgi:small-conductance mechanosensitive channel
VIIIERIVQKQLIRRFLSRTKLQSSLQFGLSRIIGYTLIAVGFYVAFQLVGVDLSSLAIIAASLGVGVGFGLQNIINNFVSGIIILAERPISIGDRIEVAGVAGRVTKIQLRSTTVVTNDNITMIVPNADFISNTVTNWSHGDPKVRIRVPVGVAYGSDLKLLQQLLLEAAGEHPKALRDPSPVVLFTEFGDSSLNFELGVWTQEMTATPVHFTSEMNFIIEQKLRENDIEIPFPQRDLHVRSGLPAAAEASSED